MWARVCSYTTAAGTTLPERFPSIGSYFSNCRSRRSVLDGEVVASDADGRPNFARLHVRWTTLYTIHLWAFDLLAFNGRDLVRSLVKGRRACRPLLKPFGCPAISLSEPLKDGVAC
jgi:ATP-dependent DNA ligase